MRLLTVLICALFLSLSCKKTPTEPEFYFKCKINGRDFVNGSCANCMYAYTLGDSSFIISGSQGSEKVGLGHFRSTKIILGSFNVSPTDSTSGIYSNQTYDENTYRTDSSNGGLLVLTEIDTINRIIAGTFYFQAFRKRDSGIVQITEGKFRRKYTRY